LFPADIILPSEVVFSASRYTGRETIYQIHELRGKHQGPIISQPIQQTRRFGVEVFTPEKKSIAGYNHRSLLSPAGTKEFLLLI
jgi:hypothetical protein